MDDNRATTVSAPAQRGSALVMVLLLALAASAIGGTLLMMSDFDHRISANERDAERALQAAKAGISYGYHLFDTGAVNPTVDGVAFNSFSTPVTTALEGAEFTGTITDLSSLMGQGQLYRITTTGTFNSSRRTTEMVFQVIPDSFRFGYMAFSEATLHNHSGLAGPTFTIDSTIMSNGNVGVPDDITINGTIVSSGTVTVNGGSTIKRDIFANDVDNDGTIEGDVTLLTSVNEIDPASAAYDRFDAFGAKYEWYNGNSTPGGLGGGGSVLGAVNSYTIQNGDIFQTELFNRAGVLLASPQVNVTHYIPPPLIDWRAMRAAADVNEPTYFATQEAAVTYLIGKKVVETISGRTVTTVKVGTPTEPEFLYIDDDFDLTLDPAGADDPGSAKIAADALFIEGGIYISGSFDFDGPDFIAAVPAYPPPPDYYMLKINALPYCYPALLAYEEPGSGTPDTWGPGDTPVLGGGSNINMSAGGDEGPSLFNGLVFAQDQIHMHHTADPREVIRFNGAELGFKLHNCDYFKFSYDPQIRCTRFFLAAGGDPSVVSYREIR